MDAEPSASSAQRHRRRVVLLFLLLTAGAFAGNYLPLSLYYRVDFLFGSVATLIVARLYGPLAGGLCAAIASSYTLFLWGHPYAIVTFALEAVFVGALRHRARGNLLLLDCAYWLFVGIPITFVSYHWILGLGDSGSVLILLKQTVNGIFNALVASLLTNSSRVRAWAATDLVGRTVSLNERLFNMLAALVLLPSLVLLVITARSEVRRVEHDVDEELRLVGDEVAHHAEVWVAQSVRALEALATVAASAPSLGGAAVSSAAQVVHSATPGFRSVVVLDAGGEVVVFEPPIDPLPVVPAADGAGAGHAQGGLEPRRHLGNDALADTEVERSFFERLKAQKSPLLSEMSPAGDGETRIRMGAPVLRDGVAVGVVVGTFAVRQLEELLAPYGQAQWSRVTLVDKGGRVVASSIGERESLEPYGLHAAGRMEHAFGGVSLWTPGDPSLPALRRIQRSVYVRELPAPAPLPWTLVLELPVQPIVEGLHRAFTRELAIALFLCLAALALASVVSRWISRPLAQLGAVTTNLAGRMLDDDEVTWPRSNTTELHRLVDNFASMVTALRHNIANLQQKSEELAAANERLTAEFQQRKRLEAQVRRAQKMEAIGTLAGGIAHDFNNILAIILGYSSLAIMDLAEDDPMRPTIQEITRAGNRAKELVQQILTFSRQREQERSPLYLQPIVKEALKLLRSSVASTIEIRDSTDPTAGPVLSEPSQVHQVLMNLCTNAEHAMRETGGLLEVALDSVVVDAAAGLAMGVEPGGYTRLTVSDTGHGVTPDVLERMFDPFFTTKDVSEGTGMGLAVVHGIVTSQGGSITVDSAPAKGTRIQVYLPRLPDVEAEGDDAPAHSTRGSEHVLFVDDEETLVLMAQEMLQRLGYRVSVCSSSRAALEAFAAGPGDFDLLITDQTMPHMTGDALARAVRKIRPDLPIILCTGFSYTMSHEKAAEQGIDAFVLKPLTLRDLGAAVRKVFDSRRQGDWS